MNLLLEGDCRMKKKFKLFKTISMLGFFISACAVLLTPWASFEPELGSRKLAYISAMLFWLGIVIGVTFEVLSSKIRKEIFPNENGKPGLISFFKNAESVITDCTFVAGVLLATLPNNNTLKTVGLFLGVLSLYYHCIFNGKNYRCFKKAVKQKEEF